MWKLLVVALTVVGCLTGPTAHAAAPPLGALARYVAQDDPSYGWVERGRATILNTPYVELILTSQTWQGTPWKHQLFIIRPVDPDASVGHALLFIDGGSWQPGRDRTGQAAELPPMGQALVAIANSLRTPVAVLQQVPYQPLFGGLYEDALIAFTFEQFLATRDPVQPALLPMVKAAVRAMDAVQAYASETWGLAIETFTVSGASKRGWTTWLTGAVDERVTGIAPMVFDMLKFPEQLRHQQAVWGAYSAQIADYTERGLPDHLESAAGQELLAIVDPYAYRHRLRQPKLIVLGTNDPYWPVDALNLYWNDLEGKNYILYMPNAGHGLASLARVTGSLGAFHQHIATGQRLPDLRWEFKEEGGELRLRVWSDIEPAALTVWVARSRSRDFRAARWEPRPLDPCQENGSGCKASRNLQPNFSNAHELTLAIPQDGYVAVFAEAAYRGDGFGAPFFFSTTVRVVGGGHARP